MLDEPIKEGQGPKINGSIMMAIAETKEEVLEKLKKDVYAKDVWDFEKVGQQGQDQVSKADNVLQVQIFPFKSAIRKAL